MNLKELLVKLYKVCEGEEFGSTEHITEHIGTDDVINVLETLDKEEYGTVLSLVTKLKELNKNQRENGDEIDDIRNRLEREAKKGVYEMCDKLFEVLKKNGHVEKGEYSYELILSFEQPVHFETEWYDYEIKSMLVRLRGEDENVDNINVQRLVMRYKGMLKDGTHEYESYDVLIGVKEECLKQIVKQIVVE